MSKSSSSKQRYQSLMAMAESNLFTIDMLMHHLLKNYHVSGVHDFLINRLYKYEDHQIIFYVPELCNLFLHEPSISLSRFLMDKAARNLNFYLLICWCVESWGFGFGKKGFKTRFELTETFLEDCENRMVNKIENVLEQANIEEMMMSKEARSDFKNDVRRFLKNLINFSLYLKKSDKDARKDIGRKFLNNMNGWLYRRKLNTKKVKSVDHHYLYEGVLFPFSPSIDSSSTLIVRIIHSEITCFETKCRVPYRMVIETIDPEDLKDHTPNYEKDPDFDGYLYLYDSDVIEEELIFEELLKQEKIETDEELKFKNEEKKQKIRKLMDYAKDKFKVEKEKTSVLSKFRSRKKKLKEGIMKILGTEADEGNPSQVTNRLRRLDTYAPRASMSSIKSSIKIPDRTPNWSKAKDSLIYRKRKVERRRSLNFYKDLKGIEGKINFFRATIFPKVYKNLTERTKSMLKSHYDELMEKRTALIDKKHKKTFKKEQSALHQKSLGPWEILWESKAQQIKNESPYGDFPSYKIRPIIVKGGDDLRQEIIAMQLIKKCEKVFKEEGTNLFVRTYEIVVTSSNSGILEFITDSISIDGLKKKYKGLNLLQIYKLIFGYNFEEAQKNFVESLASYSLMMYLFQIKDRHNGNLLIDSEGHIIHIDFGFILAIAPGGFSFENAPFKLTQDYVRLMGGENSPMFAYFKILLIQGFMSLRKYIDEFCDIVDMMSRDSKLPCYDKFDMKTFRGRFKENMTDAERQNHIETLVRDSLTSKRTVWYDEFQKLTNGYEP